MSHVAELVLSMSGELASLADHDVDKSIERALGRAGDLAGADRCYVFLRDPENKTVSNTHEWCAPTIEAAKDGLQNLGLDAFPWAFTVLDGTAELAVSDVMAIPDSAERREWNRESIRSIFLTPLRVDGAACGFLGCDWVRRTDPLAEATAQMIRVAAVLVGAALERRNAYRALQYRSGFEQLLLQISARFIDLRGDEVGAAIDEALGAIAGFVGADAGTVFLFDENGTARPIHAWRAGPGAPEAATLPVPVVSWWQTRMAGAVPVVTSAVERVEPAEVRAALSAQGIGSALDVPRTSSGRPTGVVSFSAARPRTWTTDEVQLLQLASQILSNTLARAEADRAEARAHGELRQTQKMEVIGQLAGGIAHDFNNLLLSMTICGDLAHRSLPPDAAAARAAIAEIRDAADRAASLTRQLLTFSQRRIVQVRSVDLNALIDELLRLVRRLLHESIEIHFAPGDGLGLVRADPSQVEQILMNLCVNARDAMPNGGRLTIETHAAGPDRVRLVVRDTGVGMDESVRERAFEPFFTTKPPGTSSGLGLSIVYGIVRQHGGSIRLASEPGRGTSFELDLPVARDEPESTAPRVLMVRSGRETLLLAEDDDAVRRNITDLLRSAGYTVLGARDGQDAVDVFRSHGPSIDLVILDVIMPRKSGLDAWRDIEALRPGVRTLFSSGYSMSVFPPGFFDDGRQKLIEKPYDADTLLRAIREVLDRG